MTAPTLEQITELTTTGKPWYSDDNAVKSKFVVYKHDEGKFTMYFESYPLNFLIPSNFFLEFHPAVFPQLVFEVISKLIKRIERREKHIYNLIASIDIGNQAMLDGITLEFGNCIKFVEDFEEVQ